ncbi:MAG: hypothetical protein ABUS54_05910 [Actinomycetota bacterium]
MLLGLPHWFHWADHGGYNFVSGPLADISLLTAFVGWSLLFLHKHNCHVHRCWRLAWHPHPDHGHPVCKRHHPHGKLITPTRLADSPPASSSSSTPAP